MSDTGLDIKGFDELKKELASAIDLYPDMAEERLEKTAKKFKSRVIKITKSAVKTRTGNLIKGFKLDKMRYYGINMEKDFRGTAPHFHLLENGHNLINKDGESVGKGWVPGFMIVDQARNEYGEIMPEEMKQLRDDILKECGLD